jgi:serine/threonine protein kinase
VKVFARNSTSDMFRRATARLRRTAAIHSPYLVTFVDAGQQDGVFYYAMEYLAGGSLAQPTQAVDLPCKCGRSVMPPGRWRRCICPGSPTAR